MQHIHPCVLLCHIDTGRHELTLTDTQHIVMIQTSPQSPNRKDYTVLDKGYQMIILSYIGFMSVFGGFHYPTRKSMGELQTPPPSFPTRLPEKGRKPNVLIRDKISFVGALGQSHGSGARRQILFVGALSLLEQGFLVWNLLYNDIFVEVLFKEVETARESCRVLCLIQARLYQKKNQKKNSSVAAG